MVTTLILDAVIYDRLGSISGLVFALPVLHRIPERFPKVATFFDLERDGADAPEGTGTAPSSPADGDEAGDQAVADDVRS